MMAKHPDVRGALRWAFKVLRRQGFFARMNFWCCSTCGCAAIPDGTQQWVFFHKQDNDGLNRTGQTYLTFGAYANAPSEEVVRVGENIVSVLNEAGLATEWDGSPHTRILVTGERFEKPEPTYLDLYDKSEPFLAE
jgi:hypothetical protein